MLQENLEKNKKKEHLLQRASLLAGVLFLFFLLSISCKGGELEEKELYAEGVVLMDAKTGRILYEKNGQKPMACASTTKIMTCILALEMAKEEEEVCYSAYAKKMPKVKMNANTGDVFCMKDLLYAMMLESYNDVAVSVAEHVGKEYILKNDTVDSQTAVNAFVDKMNEKAKEIGCRDTWFVTPNGLDGSITVENEKGEKQIIEHHTTAADLALIMSYCVEKSNRKDRFLEITKCPEYQVVSKSGRKYRASNHNLLLTMVNEAESGKTGYTGKAGYCYVASFGKENSHYTLALLACGWPSNKSYKWKDSKRIMEYALEHYQYYDLEQVIPKEKETYYVAILGGNTFEKEGEEIVALTPLVVQQTAQGLIMAKEEKVLRRVNVEKERKAPLKKGEILGTITYELNGEILREVALLAQRDVEQRSFLTFLRIVMYDYLLLEK